MHSSRMRTVRSSRRLLEGGCLPQCILGYTPPWVWTWTPPPPVLGLDPPGPGPGHPLGRHTPPGLGLDTPL